MADRERAYQRAYRADHQVTAAARQFVERRGNRVQAGSFTGLAYPPELLGDVDYPVARLVGSYELELHAPLDRALARSPRQFVDLGHADGYYAVGVALRVPDVTVDAFDISRDAERTCQALAEANGVGGRIRYHGIATADRIRELGEVDGLVLCDCEGAEADLFPAEVVEGLRKATVIIECHEIARPGVTDLLRHRFEPTHEVELIEARDRDESAYPEVAGLAAEPGRLVGEWERADGRTWAVCTPRA